MRIAAGFTFLIAAGALAAEPAPAAEASTDAAPPSISSGPHRIIILSPAPPPDAPPPAMQIVPPPAEGTVPISPAAPAAPPPADGEASGNQPASEKGTVPDKFKLDLSGYIRLGGSMVQADADAPFIGQTDGFQLMNARLLLFGTYGERLTFELSVDGAQDPRGEPEKGVLPLGFNLKDAFAQVRVSDALWFRFGQAKVAFSAEDLWSTSRLRFARRSIVTDGLRPGEWLKPANGLGMDRELGLAAGGGVALGDLFLEYEAAAVNGNGANRAQNDNAKVAGVARVKLTVPAGPVRLELGGSGSYNPASTGVLPNRYEERQIGYAADLSASWEGLHLFGMLLGRHATGVTNRLEAYTALGVVAQAAYRFDGLGLEPAYRFATYHPDSTIPGDKATTHSVGLNWYASELPLRALISYTLRMEEALPIANNAFEGAVQVSF